MPRFDEDMTAAEWARWEAANDAELRERDEERARFREDVPSGPEED